MSLFALIIHFKNKLVNTKKTFPIVISGILSAVGGALLASIVETQNLRIYFAIFLIVLGTFQFLSIFIVKPK